MLRLFAHNLGNTTVSNLSQLLGNVPGGGPTAPPPAARDPAALREQRFLADAGMQASRDGRIWLSPDIAALLRPDRQAVAAEDGAVALHAGVFFAGSAGSAAPSAGAGRRIRAAPASPAPGPHTTAAAGAWQGMAVRDLLRDAGLCAATLGDGCGIPPTFRVPAYQQRLAGMADALENRPDRAADRARFHNANYPLISAFHQLRERVSAIRQQRPGLSPVLDTWAGEMVDRMVDRALQLPLGAGGRASYQPSLYAAVALELQTPLDQQIAELETRAAGTPMEQFTRQLDTFFQDIVRPGSQRVQGASVDQAGGTEAHLLGIGQVRLQCPREDLPRLLQAIPDGEIVRQRNFQDMLPGYGPGRSYRAIYPPASGIRVVRWQAPDGWFHPVLVTRTGSTGQRFSQDAGRSWEPTGAPDLPGMEELKIARWRRFLEAHRQATLRSA